MNILQRQSLTRRMVRLLSKSGSLFSAAAVVLLSNRASAQLDFAPPVILGDGSLARTADIDKDGDADLFVANPYPGFPSLAIRTWYRNLGGVPPKFSDTHKEAGITLRSAFADANGDGFPDIENPAEGAIVVYFSDGLTTPSFSTTAEAVNIGETAKYRAVYATDLNHDGRMDFLSVRGKEEQGISEVVWHERNQAPGFAFTDHVLATFPGTDSYPFSLTAADMNNDGYPDIVFSGGVNMPEYGTYVFINDGHNSFSKLKVHDGIGNGQVAAADINEDGRLDIVFDAYLSINTSFSPLQYQTEVLGFQSPTMNSPMSAVDLDNDGHLDLLYPQSDRLLWRRNRGTTPVAFDDRTTFTTNPRGSALYNFPVLVDLDQDGDTDIVASAGGKLIYYENRAVFKDDVKVVTPSGGERYITGEEAAIVWRSNPQTAGTAVALELWKGESRMVAWLKNSWDAGGWGHDRVMIPAVGFGDDYRIRAVSLVDPQFAAFSEGTISISGVSGAPRSSVEDYR